LALRIEDYALIGDCRSAGLVGVDGSIDWLAFPRFDSAVCFAALLGTPDNGRWIIAPTGDSVEVRRRYRPGTLILETEFETTFGKAALIDFMPPAEGRGSIRIVVGQAGKVDFSTEFIARLEYGETVPWVTRLDDGGISAVAGPDRLVLRSDVKLRGEDLRTVGDFKVKSGQSVAFALSYGASFEDPPKAIYPFAALKRTEKFWRQWSDLRPSNVLSSP
jgi:GH15 family glucan-1,4-alpha-glucosidase